MAAGGGACSLTTVQCGATVSPNTGAIVAKAHQGFRGATSGMTRIVNQKFSLL